MAPCNWSLRPPISSCSVCPMPHNPESACSFAVPWGPTGFLRATPPCEVAATHLLYIPIGYTRGDKAMTTSTVFTSNRSQAVRLPKAFAFPAGVHQVDILKIARSPLILPHAKRSDDFFQH